MQEISQRLRISIILAVILTWLFLIFSPCVAQGEEAFKRVLLLNSYHKGFTWSDQITEGIMNNLGSAPFKVVLSTEYLDWKNYPSSENINNFYQTIKYKYGQNKLDLVITSDNAATEFALRYRKELFADAPIVFCGLYKEVALKTYQFNENITGVIENIDSEGTIRAALKIYPATRNIYVIHEQTESGIESLHNVRDAANLIDRGLKVHSVDTVSFADPATFPTKLPKDSILILTTLSRDKIGKTSDYEEMTSLLSKRISQPIFGVYEMALGHGVLGGSLLSPEIHGVRTAKIAVKILEGERASNIVPYQGHDRVLAFDHNVLKRFNVSRSLLSRDSKITNLPVSFYEKYKTLVWITLAIFTAMLIFIFSLLLNINRRKKIEAMLKVSYEELNALYEELAATDESLRHQYEELEKNKRLLEENEEKYRKVFETHSSGLIIFNSQGVIIDINPVICKIYGSTREEVIGKTSRDITAEAFAEAGAFQNFIAEINKNNFSYIETRDQTKDGQILELEVEGWKFDVQEDSYLFILRNVTESKKAQLELKRSEERYKLVFEASNEGLWDYNLTNNETYFSGEWYKNFGLEENKFFSESKWYNLIHPEDRIKIKKSINNIRKGIIDKYQTEIRVRNQAGQYIWILAKGIGMRDDAGQLVRLAGSYQDIHLKKTQEEKIRQLAYFDRVTDLPNRVSFYEWLESKLGREKTTTGAVLFIDLDNFKIINDTFGHVFGDKFLQEVGKRLKVLQNKDNLVARLGGDEFVIAVDSIHELDQITTYAKSILSLFEEPFFLDGNEFVVSASVGIALYPTDGKNIGEILKKADSAMYKAKNLGKNNFAMFDDSIEEELYSKILLSHKLRGAIERGELEVFYQPQLAIDNNRLYGFEALSRWKMPQYGFVPPLTFISLAEETGLIINIGEWVLKQACLFAKNINQGRKEEIIISVNISSVQLMQRDFVDNVQRILVETGLDPNLLGLEITESILMESFVSNARKLEQLRNMGIKISLDDFGTGYSSLNYLRQLPINMLKIDKAFIDGLTEDERVKYLTKSIVKIAHNMGLQVVAEGVETQEQLVLLKKYKCDIIQGYLISQPNPEQEAKKFLSIAGIDII